MISRQLKMSEVMKLDQMPSDVYDRMQKFMDDRTLFKFITLTKKITVDERILEKRMWLSRDLSHWAGLGNLKAVKYLMKKNCLKGSNESKSAMYITCEKGRLNVLKYLVSLGEECNFKMIFPAVINGHLDILTFLYENGQHHPYALYDAALIGHLDIVQYLYSIGQKATLLEVNKACQYGHLDLLIFFHKTKAPMDNQCIDLACISGYIEVVKFLHTIGCGFTQDAINWASAGGFLELVQYLVSIGAVATDSAIDYAAEKCHMPVVKYLHSLGARCSLPYGVECNIEIVPFLDDSSLNLLKGGNGK